MDAQLNRIIELLEIIAIQGQAAPAPAKVPETVIPATTAPAKEIKQEVTKKEVGLALIEVAKVDAEEAKKLLMPFQALTKELMPPDQPFPSIHNVDPKRYAELLAAIKAHKMPVAAAMSATEGIL